MINIFVNINNILVSIYSYGDFFIIDIKIRPRFLFSVKYLKILSLFVKWTSYMKPNIKSANTQRSNLLPPSHTVSSQNSQYCQIVRDKDFINKLN